jgi:hypothetical protein
MRAVNEQMRQKLMTCQERTMLFLQSGQAGHEAAQHFVTEILHTTLSL